jgi:hypothetical protein
MSTTTLRTARAGRTRAFVDVMPSVVGRALLVSRALVLAAGAVASLTVPRVAGWQPFDPFGFSISLGRVGDALTATAVRWDAIHYLQIARFGYRFAGDTAFFPFYPMIVHAGAWLTGSDVSSGILISVVSFAVALTLLYRLTELELGTQAAHASVLLLAFAPLSLFFSAVYSESLFLALSVGALYAARRERFATACVLAALTAVTRVPGIVVVIPVAMMLWRSPARSRRLAVCLLAAPLALIAFLGYLAARGFGWLAPLVQQISIQHLHVVANPFATLGYASGALVSGISSVVQGAPILDPGISGAFSVGFQSILLFAVLAVAVAALVLAYRRLPRPYVAYALLMLLSTLCSPTLTQPLEGLDRYVLVIFPLTMAAGAWLSERRWTAPAVVFGGALMCFYAFQVATWTFLG